MVREKRSDAAKASKPVKKRAQRVKKADPVLHQGYLPDGAGGSMEPTRIPAIDKAAKALLEAREELALWNESKKEANAKLKEALREAGVTKEKGRYFVDYGSEKYGFAIGGEPQVLCELVKQDK